MRCACGVPLSQSVPSGKIPSDLSCQEGDWENCLEILLFSAKVRGKSSLNVQDTKLAAQWPFQVHDLEDSDPSAGSGR